MRGHATAGQNTRWLTAWNLISTDGSRNQWHEDFIDVRLRRNSGIDRDGQPMRQALRSIGAVLVKIRHDDSHSEHRRAFPSHIPAF